MRKKTFIAAGVALSIAAIALALGVVLTPASTSTAYAAEIAQKSYQAVDALPPEQQGEVGKKLQVSDPKELLQKAKNAKDLKALTYDQYASQYPLPPKGTDILRRLTFLQFTDADGSQFVLGIDPEDKLPSFVSVERGNPGGATKKGDQGTIIHQENFGSANDTGTHFSFQSSSNVAVEGTISAEGKVTFTVNGRKYALPAGAKFSMESPPSAKVEGNDVYVNGIKLIPEN